VSRVGDKPVYDIVKKVESNKETQQQIEISPTSTGLIGLFFLSYETPYTWSKYSSYLVMGHLSTKKGALITTTSKYLF